MTLEEEQNEQIRFSSITENLTIAERLVDKVCEEGKISEDFYGNILVAVTEAVVNAIDHGNKKNPKKQVGISYELTETSLTFSIEDEGPGFDYENLPDPTNPENIEKPNGRGIFLMKKLADEVGFENEGRVVQLEFKVG